MADQSYLQWPFFEPRHREMKSRLEQWLAAHGIGDGAHAVDPGPECRRLVGMLGRDGWLRHAVPPPSPGVPDKLDVRSLALIRETLAYRSGLVDFAFAMQGLGSGPISLFGTGEQRRRWLTGAADGRLIAAFALSERNAGSDVAAMTTYARREGDGYVIDGEKTWISNGGIADFYLVFARTGEAQGAKGISAFIVPADAAGVSVTEQIHVIAPHPLATMAFEGVRVPADSLVGRAGHGFAVAMATLDVFRTTVGAAALGLARRAQDEAVRRAASREIFGTTLAALQLPQAMLADNAVAIDAAALLVYRAAWTKDQGQDRVTREAAIAKYYATEEAQRVIDRALQLHGGLGVVSGHPVEVLYREIRALRIYEGASEVQRLIIAHQELAGRDAGNVP